MLITVAGDHVTTPTITCHVTASNAAMDDLVLVAPSLFHDVTTSRLLVWFIFLSRAIVMESFRRGKRGRKRIGRVWNRDLDLKKVTKFSISNASTDNRTHNNDLGIAGD